MSNLVAHAKEELTRAGLFSEDSDYGGMLGRAILKMVEVFASEGHSGMSANIALAAFNRVARFQTLTPITNDPAEWRNVSDYGGPDDKPIWQNRRDSTYFSNDGGQTGYSIDDTNREVKTFPAKEI